jgi:peptidyl-prolyl cis-trans isomerase D
MLKTMRKITKPIMWFVAIMFVGFLGWQGAVNIKGQGNIAIINGQDIPYQAYQSFYDRNYQLAQKEYGDTVEFDKVINEQIRTKTWEDIVTQALLSQEAKKRGLVVTDKEVFEYLRRFPPFEILRPETVEQFMTDGQFDYNKYAQALLDPRSDWSSVEAYVRDRLLIAKLQMMVTGLVRVSPAEVKQQWIKENTTLDLKFVRFPVERYQEQIQFTPEQLEQFYQKNKERFPRDERAELYYVEFLKKPQTSDELAAKKKLEEIKAQIKTDSDFATLAKTYSEDKATRDNGGDLGWVEAGSFIPAFDQTLRKMQPGEVSEPLRSSYGWHLLKLWQKSVGGPQEQFHLSHILVIPKMSDQGLKELKQQVNDFAREAKSSNLEKAAEKFKLTLVQTGWFSKGGYIQGLGKNDPAEQFAFSAKTGQVSDIIETPSGYYFLQLKEYLPAGPAALNEIRPQLLLEYKRVNALQRCLDDSKTFYQLIRKGENLIQAAKAAGQTVNSTGKFKASEPLIPQVANEPELVEAALNLSKPGQISPPVQSYAAVFILELVSRESSPDSQYVAIQDSLYRMALDQKQNEIYSQWYSQLRSRAEVKDYRNEYFKEEETPSQG